MSPPSRTQSELHDARRHHKPSTRAVSAPTAPAAADSSGIRMGSGWEACRAYTLLDKLGGGAFGVVPRALHCRSGEVVTIKSSHHGGDELLQEASLRRPGSGGAPESDARPPPRPQQQRQ
ncbi:hypothetical protein EJB05_27958, partial [Eragrostis curvula]